MERMSNFTELPSDLQILISNYEPQFIILCEPSNWHLLIKQNFGLVFSTSISSAELCEFYREKCRRQKYIYGGVFYTVIRSREGVIMSCGTNVHGQLGCGNFSDRSIFEWVRENVSEIICGGYHIIIRLYNGRIMGCGCNKYGQLGLGDRKNRTVFEEIRGLPHDIFRIICGRNYTMIQLRDGKIMACGNNLDGQLGFGDTRDRTLFEEVGGLGLNISEITPGDENTFIRFADGNIMSCGWNKYGQLGHGDNINRTMFEKIQGLPKNIAHVYTTGLSTFIRLTSGKILSCGHNMYGQCGHGDRRDRAIFEEIDDIPRNILEITGSKCSTFIRLADGQILGCGMNKCGELGVGDKIRRTSFENVKLSQNVVEIIPHFSCTFIRLADGKIMSCGYNRYGQLGHGDKIEKCVFEEIRGLPAAVDEIVIGHNHTFIRLFDGRIMSCGQNGRGRLGHGDTIDRTVFEEIKNVK